MELISVIIPVYKVERYLDQCLESVVNQTYRNLEIIVVDDGSPDRCPSMCDAWAEKDARIRVIHKANGGLSDARNAGLDIASGAYISFVDSDDYLSPDCMEKLHRALKESGADISAANYTKVDESGSVLPKERWETLDSRVLTGKEVLYDRFDMYSSAAVLVVAWAKLYRREIFREYRFAKGRLNEDEFAFFPVYMGAEKVACIADPVYFYLQRSGSIMGQKITEKRIRDNMDYWQERLELTKEDMVLHKKTAAAYCSWLFLTALPELSRESGLYPGTVALYRRLAERYVFDRNVNLPLAHRLIYYIAILNPKMAADIKRKLAG